MDTKLVQLDCQVKKGHSIDTSESASTQKWIQKSRQGSDFPLLAAQNDIPGFETFL